ncbi:MAG: hypothetical protein KY469_07315 [Actinobacteria bacterium]|nr:hypothetical protein [Actinomycetota bacterium]
MRPVRLTLVLALAASTLGSAAATGDLADTRGAEAAGPEEVVTELLPDDPASIATDPVRDTEPVVLTGDSFPTWSVPADQSVHPGSADGKRCAGGIDETPVTPDDPCTTNTYEDPWVSSGALAPVSGPPTDRILGYRWTGEAFEQIPLQVDEMFPRFLSNNRSGFAFYSETDQHLSYAFDREGFRWRASHPDDPCLAMPDSDVAVDPVQGLDSDDEIVFMARDAGEPAPPTAPTPPGILAMHDIALTDPHSGVTSYVYVGLTETGGPAPAFDATSGYVRYERDPDANVFLFSESSYENYGAALPGPYHDPATGECIGDDEGEEIRQRRPGDQATITTPRYRFRYEGRWLMTEISVSEDEEGDWTYGTDLLDQWKARAFQQRPGGETPCCGYEEEVNNWGGSSQLMGERSGPVRTIRETWGADSGTNVVRREIFYRDEIRWINFLRVHVIPPLDGIYVQLDYNADAVSRYYNPNNADGVAIDGIDDEVFGNSHLHVGDDGFRFDDPWVNERNPLGGPVTVGDPDPNGCSGECVHNDIDTTDPWFSGPSGNLHWEQIAGEHGTLVTRWSLKEITPGAAQSVFATPYYRDDACFDDGTGSSPGPHLRSRKVDSGEFATWRELDPETGEEVGEPLPRECWDAQRHAEDPDYARYLTENPRRFWQGSIGTHGLHLLLVAESDNAMTTQPLTEIDSEQRMVVLAPTLDNVGEAYGRSFEKPLVAAVTGLRSP